MLIDQIDSDLTHAMKSKDTLQVNTLRLLKASITNFLIEKRRTRPVDSDVISLIHKQLKQRQDAIDSFQKAGRTDLADKESREKTYLSKYLPTPLSDHQLLQLVDKAIAETGANSKADLGKVIKTAIGASAGGADASQISRIAADKLK